MESYDLQWRAAKVVIILFYFLATGSHVQKGQLHPQPKKKKIHALKLACKISTESKKRMLLPPLSADSNYIRFSKSGA